MLAFQFLGDLTSQESVELTYFLDQINVLQNISHCIFYSNYQNELIAKALWVLSNLVVCQQDRNLEKKMVQRSLDDVNLSQKICKLIYNSTDQ